MKARVRATGEIVEVVGTTQYDEYDVVSKDGVYFSLNQLELIGQSLTKNKSEDPDYWTRLEHQAAIAAMQAQMAPNCLDSPEGVACTAYAYAHALVEKIKEKEERK